MGPPSLDPVLGLGFEIPCSAVGVGAVTLTVWKPPPHHAAVPGPAKNRVCSLDRLSPSPASCSWPCFWEAHFLGGGSSDPTMGTSLSGATLPSCTSIYHPQAGREQRGDRAPVSPEAAVILCCLGLAGSHGDTSRTPSHPQLAHLALPGNC